MRHDHRVLIDEALRERLSALATAAGLAVPPLEVSGLRTPELLAEVRDHSRGERIVASPALLEADPAVQTWHLATCLGWWTSPVPRRRRRQGWATAGVLVLAQAVLGLAQLSELVDLPRGVLFTTVVLLGGLALPLHPAMARREQRALDSAGCAVMAASGHEPGTLVRQVFGDRRDPPWFRRLVSNEPAPSRRIVAADRWRARPHDSLY
jgi:hypothetical protein